MATAKTATKKAASRKPPKNAGTAQNARVRVRMYRHGLGDCFLLTFPGDSGKPFSLLIDCGVILGAQDPQEKLGSVLDDIADVTGGRVDLLVVTHEHWDHVSGFAQVRDRFDSLEISRVWVGWTEDPGNKLANKLRRERKDAEKALRMAVTHLGLAGDTDTADRVHGLVEFFGAKSGSTPDAMQYATGRAPERKPKYCHPGEPPIELKELPGVRFWVMGPPENEKLIKKSAPGKNEAYGLDAGPGGSQALLLAGFSRRMGAAPEIASLSEDPVEDPFDPAYCIPMARAQHVPFFERRYFGPSPDSGVWDRSAKADLRDQSWRRIDSEWMGGAEALALQLDSATNNTSLVLAIELTDTKEVLLFPGDAQAGNWLSWQDLKWTEDGKTVTGPDLLARTILYKVGHHGSHNATLRDKGLELMVSDKLVAMVPVDHAMAVKKGWGKIPLEDLITRLRQKTNGRLLMADDEVASIEDLSKLRPDDVSKEDWNAFTKRVQVKPLYYEVSF